MRTVDIIMTDPEQIAEHVNHYTNIFTSNSNTIQNGMTEEVIHELITYRINNMLTLWPSREEITSCF
jgi:hypothetical protein